MFAKILPYKPLVTVVLLSCLLPVILEPQIDATTWMHYMMGFFLVLLAMLKLFDISGFKKGFAKYDLLTQRFPLYGYVYPFIELGLGLAYLSQAWPLQTYVLTILVLGGGLIGILKARREGRKLNCACMGNVLNVPLSTVSIVENFGMAAMALAMLVHHLN